MAEPGQAAAGSAAPPQQQAALEDSCRADRDGNGNLVKEVGITCALASVCTCDDLSMAVSPEFARSMQ